MSAAPYNGFATGISIQRETTFLGASVEPVHNLTGKIKFTQSVEFAGKGSTMNVWREMNTSHFAGKFYQGAIELELGLNEVVKLLLSGFFEIESIVEIKDESEGVQIFGEGVGIFGEGEQISGEPNTIAYQFTFRPPRLKSFQSFKIGLDFDTALAESITTPIEGEGSGIFGEGGGIYGEEVIEAVTSRCVRYSGLVIDAIKFDIRRNQVPKILVQFKAALREEVVYPALSGAIVGDVRRVHHTGTSVTLDSQEMALTEANLAFAQPKTPNRFAQTKLASRFGVSNFDMSGELVEYFGPDAILPDAILDQNDHVFFMRLTDPLDTVRKLEFYWPKLNFKAALPEAISRTDLICRAGFDGLQDSERESVPKIILVV